MRTLFRLVKKSHSRDAFSGEGARLAGGRWNPEGTAVVYLSGTLSLAVLELFVHLPGLARSIEFVSFEVSVPNDVPVEEIAKNRLPRNWRDEPAPEETQKKGGEWIKKGETALLQIPSVIVPSEMNYALNPAHPDFGRLKISRPQPFSFDPRMWK